MAVLIVAFVLAACAPVPPGDAAQPSAVTMGGVGDKAVQRFDRTCDLYLPKDEIEGETILCGYVRVAWDRAVPDGEATDLAYVVLKATGPHPLPDPIVHVAGGPGAGSTLRDVVLEFILRYAPLREERDIILYDQRGMGRSIPFFACSYPDDTQAMSIRQDLQAKTSEDVTDADILTVFCQQDLTVQGYPPSGISTATSAADLTDLLTALGYPAYNLYAISYGTRLVMSFMHYFPNSPLVRSVVLDSTYPLPEDRVNDYLAEPTLYELAMFEAVFEECAADSACVVAYPDIRQRFDRLVKKLDTEPLSFGDGQIFTGEDLSSRCLSVQPCDQLHPVSATADRRVGGRQHGNARPAAQWQHPLPGHGHGLPCRSRRLRRPNGCLPYLHAGCCGFRRHGGDAGHAVGCRRGRRGSLSGECLSRRHRCRPRRPAQRHATRRVQRDHHSLCT